MRRESVGRRRPVRLTGALALLFPVAGAGLLAVAPRLSLGTPSGSVGGPVFGVWPLLVVLAAAPPVLALMLTAVRQRAAAMALVSSVGAVSVGRLVGDAWLAWRPASAVRPELLVPLDITPVRPGAGGSLLVAGQACLVLAGWCAAVEAGRRRAEHGTGRFAGRRPAGDATRPAGPSGPAAATAVACAALAGMGLLTPPFGSAHPFLPARAALDSPAWPAAGALLVAAAVVLAAAVAATAPDHRVTAGGLVGAALAVLGVALPVLVVAVRTPALGVAPGPVVAVAGALGMAAVARRAVLRANRPPRPAPDLRTAPAEPTREQRADRWRELAGSLCATAGACAVGAFLTDPVRLADAATQPRVPTVGLLLSTGLVLFAVGSVTMSRAYGWVTRPALAVVAMAMPMAAAEYIGAVLDVLDLPGVGAGLGWWLAVVAVLAALASVVASLLAGGFERDDVDLSARSFGGPTAPAAAAAAVLALPTYLLPLVDGAGRGVTGILQPSLGLAHWALAGALLTTVAVGLLGPRCRPGRAAALYTGVCLLLVLRMARLPFGPRPLPVAGPAEGAVAGALCLALFLMAATVAVHAAQAGASRGPRPLSSPEPMWANSRRLWPWP